MTQWTMVILQTIFTKQRLSFRKKNTLNACQLKLTANQFHTINPNMRNVQIKKFSFFYRSFATPYIDCSYSDYKKCTAVRNNVQFLYSFDNV